MKMNKNLIAYTDGGARGNPGPAGAGAVLYAENKSVITEVSEFLGVQTNNWAEYEAIFLMLAKVKKLGFTNVPLEIRADSKLAVEQLNGNWKVKHPNIQIQFKKVTGLLKDFKDVRFVHVRREKNKVADALANKAMDTAL